MADYAKKKNDELAQLCKDRSLPHTGKKADLVKRLEEFDAKNTGGAAPAKPAGNEDEIDWDDEPATETAKAATNEAAANAIAAGGQGELPNPQAVPNQEAAVDPSKTDELEVAPPASEPAAIEEKKEEKDFSTGLADRTLDEEIEKRKARLRKFGVPEDDEEWKKLERAQKFGNMEILGGLNKALSNEKPGKKRGREDGAEKEGGNQRDRKRSRGRAGRKQGGAGGAPGEKKPEKESSNGGYPGWMTQADKDAADRRKAKFSTA